MARGGAFPVRDTAELMAVLKKLKDPGVYENASAAVTGYLEESRGATGKVLGFLEGIKRAFKI